MKPTDFTYSEASWADVMPMFAVPVEYDEDSPPLDFKVLGEPTIRFKGRIIPPRKSPSDPFDPEVLVFIKSLTPLVQMEAGILGGMPVFKNTQVPIKRMFDYLLAGKSLDDFLAAAPTVKRDTAVGVLKTEATLFYEGIAKALDTAQN